MANKISFGSVNPDNGSLFFRPTYGENFYVKSLNRGVILIEPIKDSNLPDLLETLVTCFHKSSNFYGLKAINFWFNGVFISINKKNANAEKLLQFFHEESAKLDEENQKNVKDSRKLIRKIYNDVEK